MAEQTTMKQNSLPIIFIVGSSRSGTTMFNRVLGNHPDILGLNELHFIDRKCDIAAGELWGREKAISEAAGLMATAKRSLWDEKPTTEEMEVAVRLMSDATADGVDPVDVFGAAVEHLLRESGRRIATDQTPRNILYVDKILNVFPNAKVIQLIRDPRAVLFSQKNRWRQRSLGAKDTPLWNAVRVFANYHVITVCKLWNAAYLKGRAVGNHKNFMALRFEDLVDAPEKSLKRVCEFLEVPYTAEMLDVPRVGSSNLQHREDVRGISSDVVHAWEGKLSAAEIWLCQRLTRDAMRELGYAESQTNTPVLGLFGQVLRYPLHILGVLVMNPRLAIRVAKAMGRSAK